MAKSQQEVLTMLSAGNFSLQPFLLQWQNVFYRTSIHTTGTCPQFYPLNFDRTNGYSLATTITTPAWWISERYDIIFNTHLLNRYPREPEEIREFRKSVYRPYQTAPLLECINSLQACIFGDSKYTLVINDTKDQEYIDGKNFEGKTFIQYFEWLFKAICEDPNSLFVVMPKVPRKDTGDMVEPTIKHIPSADILWIAENEVVYFEPYSSRNYAWWVNEMGYFRYQKNDDGTYTNMDGDNDGYFAHLLTRKPIHFAGGIWNTMRYYDSYLKAAIPYCDDFVAAHSDVQMVNKEACFPFIQMVQTDCPTCQTVGEIQFCDGCHSPASICGCAERNLDNIHKIQCPGCKGNRFVMSFNPGQRVMVPKDIADQELIKIINFDVNVNKYMHEYSESVKEGIRAALHQQYIDESQSGKAKEIDREAEYLYRSMVSKGIWTLIDSCLTDILSLRHTAVEGDNRVVTMPSYELVQPTDFALKTEGEILAEITESIAAKAPEFIVKKIWEMYADKVFGCSDIMKKKVSVINQLDTYSVTPITDKSAMLASNGITIEQFVYSNNLPTVIDKLIRDRGAKWFVAAKIDDIQKVAQTEIDLIAMPEPIEPKIEKTEVIE